MRRVRVPVRPSSQPPAAAKPVRKQTGRKSPQPPPVEPEAQMPLVQAEPEATTLPPLNLLQLDPVESKIDENELVRLGERLGACGPEPAGSGYGRFPTIFRVSPRR